MNVIFFQNRLFFLELSNNLGPNHILQPNIICENKFSIKIPSHIFRPKKMWTFDFFYVKHVRDDVELWKIINYIIPKKKLAKNEETFAQLAFKPISSLQNAISNILNMPKYYIHTRAKIYLMEIWWWRKNLQDFFFYKCFFFLVSAHQQKL